LEKFLSALFNIQTCLCLSGSRCPPPIFWCFLRPWQFSIFYSMCSWKSLCFPCYSTVTHNSINLFSGMLTFLEGSAWYLNLWVTKWAVWNISWRRFPPTSSWLHPQQCQDKGFDV
jgi:hypothetical protein